MRGISRLCSSPQKQPPPTPTPPFATPIPQCHCPRLALSIAIHNVWPPLSAHRCLSIVFSMHSPVHNALWANHSRTYRGVLRCGEFSSSTPVAPNAKCAKPVIPICVFSQFPKTLRVQRKHSSLSRFVYFTPTRARRIHAPFHAATECLSNQCKDLHGFKTFTTQRCILSTDSPTWLGASLRVNACGAAKRSLILEHTRFLKCCDTLGSS